MDHVTIYYFIQFVYPTKLKIKMMSERLVVLDKFSEDNSIVHISPEKMVEMGLNRGDLVLLQGRLRHETVCVVVPDDSINKNSVMVNSYAMYNLNAKPFEKIKISAVPNAVNGKKIHVLPFEDHVRDYSTGTLFCNFLKPYFEQAYRPLMTGNVFGIKGSSGFVEFKVVATIPLPYCVVSPDTLIYCSGTPLKREDELRTMMNVGYDDIGGCKEAINVIREVVELPLIYPKIYELAGIKAPKGILLYGPPGTGKTLIARAISNETRANFFSIDGPELMSKFVGESEGNLRKIFQEANQKSPSIIFIDEIDALAPRRHKTFGELEKRIVAQLLTLMDGISQRNNVLVLAATNQPNAIDPALRRYGRFDREIEIGLPTVEGRLEILKIHTDKMKLDSDVDLSKLAAVTHGFAGSDLAGLCVEAATLQIRSQLQGLNWKDEVIDMTQFENMRISREKFELALSSMKPSGLRELLVEIPKVSWEEVAGLETVKQELIQHIQYPILYPQEFKHFDLMPSKGILLFGPPGCGKTLIAKALANECGLNFIAIKGSDLLSMWFGESEANIRDIFSKARASHPCILFFDEIDSVAKLRSSMPGNGGGAEDRIVNQILIEMDGMTPNNEVFVIGATNRPDIIDSAIIRPGRIDQLIYIPLPDLKSRVSIFKAKLKATPLDETVNFQRLANVTSGFSGADIAEVCRKAKLCALKEMTGSKGTKNHKVKFSHFEEALKSSYRSVSEFEAGKYDAFYRSVKEGRRTKRFCDSRFTDEDVTEDFNLYS